MIRSGRPRIACLVVAFLALAAGGCGGKSSSTTSTSHQAPSSVDFGDNTSRKVVAFGDSITVGFLELRRRDFRLITANNYPNILQAKLKALDPAWIVVNRGVGGEQTFQGVARIPSVLAQDKPGFVLIMEGTNDASRCRDANVTVNNLTAMVSSAKRNQSIPILGTIPPNFRTNDCPDYYILEANTKLRAMASAEGIIVAEIYEALSNRALFGVTPERDPLHPNEAGYAVMADVWYQAILQAIPGGTTAALRRRG